MNVANKVKHWGDSHHPGILDILRIFLGFFLLLKGCAFLANVNYLERILANQQLTTLSEAAIAFIMFVVVMLHIVGGVLIMLGIYTRAAAIAQLPVVIAAMFVINIFKSPFNTDFYALVITLILLLVFIVIGSGTFSLDRWLEDIKAEKAKH
ncbi:DoxX family protein [Inquilinus sp. KBS0705]|nr:DoxX family protein [Inquilinus sp. KBS0705]